MGLTLVQALGKLLADARAHQLRCRCVADLVFRGASLCLVDNAGVVVPHVLWARRAPGAQFPIIMQYQPAELENYPGYHIRRLQQIAVAVFMEETEEFAVTPVQYAALSAVLRQPGVDQRTLARTIGFDTSTIGSVIDRLEARGLMLRNISPTDRRVRLLTLTEDGQLLLQQAEPSVLRAQRRMLDPLPDDKRAQFMEMLSLLIHENDEFARAPSVVAERSAERKRSAAVKAVKRLPGGTLQED